MLRNLQLKKIKLEILGLSSSQSQSGSFALVLGETEGNRAKEIEKALDAVATLLTGDLKNISDANGTVLNQWMETSAVLVDIRPAKKAQPEAAPVPKSAH